MTLPPWAEEIEKRMKRARNTILKEEMLKLLEALRVSMEALEFYGQGDGRYEEDSEWVRLDSPAHGMDSYGVKARGTLEKLRGMG